MVKRIIWIDYAKSLAIVGVVLCHTIQQDNPLWIINISSVLSTFHVPLFFFVSGYLFNPKERHLSSVVWINIKSLLVPYLFFNLFSAPILYKLQSKEVWLTGFHDFILCNGHSWAGPAWFLVALFNIKILFHFLRNKSVSTITLFTLLISILPLFIHEKIYFGISSAMIGFPFYIIGYFTKKSGLLSMFSFNKLYLFLLFLFLLVIIKVQESTYYIDISKGKISDFSSYLYSFLAIIMALAFCMMFNSIRTKIIILISNSCIVIMGMHMTIIQCLWGIKGKLPQWLWFLCESPAIALTSFIMSLCLAVFMLKYTPILIGNRKSTIISDAPQNINNSSSI